MKILIFILSTYLLGTYRIIFIDMYHIFYLHILWLKYPAHYYSPTATSIGLTWKTWSTLVAIVNPFFLAAHRIQIIRKKCALPIYVNLFNFRFTYRLSCPKVFRTSTNEFFCMVSASRTASYFTRRTLSTAWDATNTAFITFYKPHTFVTAMCSIRKTPIIVCSNRHVSDSNVAKFRNKNRHNCEKPHRWASDFTDQHQEYCCGKTSQNINIQNLMLQQYFFLKRFTESWFFMLERCLKKFVRKKYLQVKSDIGRK